MKPVKDISAGELRSIKGVLFDIDDTFTLEGKIPAEAYDALWRLHESGLILVPITGRPAGWCDHIARMWPVDGIVGENGAFYYYYNKQMGRLMRRYIFDPEETRKTKQAMEEIRDEVSRRVPHARVSADQNFRLFDLAIDFAEDVPSLSKDEIDEICAVFRENQATFKVSSIHVNGWFGDYNKLTTTKLFLSERYGLDWEEAERSFAFVGDSPNDEPMFEAFPISVGVANVNRFIDMMKSHPAYVTARPGGLGFAELAEIIVHSRS
ncbi:MAG TPA: HAD-IIB family hydrolase [Deltaproteobacteria bacterium]|nr:HAD-IIB family hydrolase [Deltaproteobacteria bacterium]HPR52285.1 HAD-IIB family hydrolase [Deltaproteobacteria bacterium]